MVYNEEKRAAGVMGSVPAPPRFLASTRVFPDTPSPTGPVTKSLSIADATTARFSICGAIWFYEGSPAAQNTTLLAQHLEQGLRQTLDDYRHFAGQLRWSTPADAHLLPGPQTLGRPLITYNAPTDPGVDFRCASDPRTLDSVLPSKDRTAEKKIWRATDFKQDDLLPSCPLAFQPDLGVFDGLPGVSAQLTTFACGGWAMGVRMTHCLGDAMCLVAFTKLWASRARILLSGGVPGEGAVQEEKPAIFDPALLDRHAGVCKSSPPDNNKIALARSLPMHRYDCWETDAPGIPAWARKDALATQPDAQTLAGVQLSPATLPPWESWDASVAVEHVQIRVTAPEVLRLKEAAQAGLPVGGFVSRLDALIAHLWIAVNRARGLQELGESVYLNQTFGLRSRVEPNLPDAFAGSPLLIAHVCRTGAEVCAASLGSVALELRKMMARFTPEAVGAYLHDAAYEISPMRLWQAFLGVRQLGVTSWTKAGVYEIDFGAGRPRYIQARMPRLAGQVQVLDIRETGEHEVSLCLEKEVMERLLEDWSLET